jgi:aspartyl-tRNA(Asn)/glutamyl-tRNA(Gln) amidotransferase subunit A
MSEPLWQQDACSLADGLAAGTLTAVEILDHFLGRIKALNPTLNAVVHLKADAHADAQASAQRHASGTSLSRIDGLPILIKDNLVVRDMPATWGSRLYADRVCTDDEIPVEKLRRAGAIIVGKTNVPEFTVEGYTDNELFGLTPNPWDLSVTPGGSSGGSVAAVAAGMIPLSIGTDGGGSVRRPAAYAGLVGLKPTIGRIPRGGGLPQLLLDMEVIGPITRSVRDQAMLFDVLAQPDIRDHRSLAFPAARSLENLDDTPQGLRILAVETFGDAPLDPIIRQSFRDMVGLLKSMGHRVETGALPLDIQGVTDNWTTIGDIGLGLLLQREPQMRTLASAKYVEWASKPYAATHLLEVTEMITKLRNEAAGIFQSLDLIMTPSCAAMPWSTDLPFPPEIDSQPVGPRGSAVYTGWVNACGHPAISVPGARCDQFLPVGIQFVGNSGDDELLLRLARQIESEQGWLDIWPEIALDGK